MNKFLKSIVSVLLLFLLLTGCSSKDNEKHTRELFALDTYITLAVYGEESTAKGALDAVADRLNEIENHMSISIENNDIDNINKNAGIEPVQVNEDTFYVLKKALYYSELTDGIFDITIYPLVELWDIKSENPRVPEHKEILEKLALVDYKKVNLNDRDKTVFLEDKGMKIDLGGIAKGYAADEAAKILKNHGIKHALINLGGNILVLGSKPDKTSWRIGIRDPRGDANSTIAVVEAVDKTVVTSGDYERYMVKIYEDTGKRYHHIFDPRTGYPAESGLMGAAIVGRSSIDADALSTCLFILGAQEGLELIKGLPDTDGIAISDKKQVYITEGLKDDISMKANSYKLVN